MSLRHRASRVPLAVALLALVAAFGCSPRASLPRPHANWLFGADLPGFDPDGPPDVRRAALERLMTRGLLAEDSLGSIRPAAAESIGISADSLVYTFRLRRGLAFVDGTPCSSRDFRIALLAGLARADHATRRWQLAAVRGVDMVRSGRPLPDVGVDVPDERTLRLRLRVRDPLLLRKLAVPGAADAWKSRRVHDWGQAIGLGPFRVQRADSTRELVLVRARSPFAGAELPDSLSVRFLANATRMRALLRVGRPDLVWPVPPDLLRGPIPAGYRTIAQESHPARWLLLVLRADLPPTSKLPARHALSNGINRPELLRTLKLEAADVGAWIPGAPSFEFPALDPQEIELWRERGDLGRSFHVVMTYDANGTAADVARTMQGEWASHSIYVELKPLTGAARATEFLAGRSQLVLADVQDLIDQPAALAAWVMPLRGPAVGAVRTGWRTREFDAIVAPDHHGAAWDPAGAQRRIGEERIVLPLARLRWVWIERAAGPVAVFHPRFGPMCPSPTIPR